MILDYFLVALVALVASGLTLFSGFGLGTILMPSLALLFPLPVAIAATAVVHLANNLFKLVLVGRHADWSVVARFGTAAGTAAIVGAYVLTLLADLPALGSYDLIGAPRSVTVIKLVIGTLIAVFALLELRPRTAAASFPKRYLIPGGALSGFFGGLSGNQGALRAGFLIRAGLTKHAFVGTSVVCAIIVDTIRIGVYGWSFFSLQFGTVSDEVRNTVVVAAVAAFSGAYVGMHLLEKVTFRVVQLTVASMMIVVGIGLALGLL